jgi:Ca2+-binding RTX toxin-like protein
MLRHRCIIGVLAAGLILPGAVALANTSHAGWPVVARADIQINKTDANTTLNAHPGVHNELLGGNGNDTLNGGPLGDVLWGDYKPGNQPTTQVDHINAGPGMDFIYASHGINYISTGGGGDKVHAHYGSGQIRCGSAKDIVYISHKSKPHYKLIGCKRISFATVGY